MEILGLLCNKYINIAINKVFSCGFVLAYELLDIVVDCSFASVVDVNYDTY